MRCFFMQYFNELLFNMTNISVKWGDAKWIQNLILYLLGLILNVK
jgi:hypothetical protein